MEIPQKIEIRYTIYTCLEAKHYFDKIMNIGNPLGIQAARNSANEEA